MSAFAAVPIGRAIIREPTAHWDVYDDEPGLVAFEDQTWCDLPAALLKRHSTLPVYAGDAFFCATLPAFLRYLMHERESFNDLPWQLASQLTRKDDPESHPRFDRRVALLSAGQRATLREVLAFLATLPPMDEVMSIALATWDSL